MMPNTDRPPSTSAHRPRKRFGQHFLTDANVIRRIVELIAPQATDHVIEIGPGPGALTEHLAEHVGQLDLIEIDRDLAAALRERYAGSAVQVHEMDALKLDLAAFFRPSASSSAPRVVGNLPYNVGTEILMRLLTASHPPRDMVFLLQKEVVDRLLATPGSRTYGRLSVMAQALCEVRGGFLVKPGSFTPPPKVDSKLVALVPHSPNERLGSGSLSALDHIVRLAFGQRRKMIGKSLRGHVSETQLQDAGIEATSRPEQIPVSTFVALASAAARRGTNLDAD